jgi:hypothetical protein
MSEQNKTIWEIPPREPIPRQDVPGSGPEHPERQSEGNHETRHKKNIRRRNVPRES